MPRKNTSTSKKASEPVVKPASSGITSSRVEKANITRRTAKHSKAAPVDAVAETVVAAPSVEAVPAKAISAQVDTVPAPLSVGASSLVAAVAEVSEQEAISALAYSYWCDRGRQGGSMIDDWTRAEREYRRGKARAASA